MVEYVNAKFLENWCHVVLIFFTEKIKQKQAKQKTSLDQEQKKLVESSLFLAESVIS
jgi:hypothetical protein